MKRRKLQLEELNRISIDAFKEAENFRWSLYLIMFAACTTSVRCSARAMPLGYLRLSFVASPQPLLTRRYTKRHLVRRTPFNGDTWKILSWQQSLKAEGYILLAIEQAQNSLSLEEFTLNREKIRHHPWT